MPDLQINKVVVHELVKEQHQGIQESRIRPTVLDVNSEVVNKLVSGITNLYGRRNNSAHYGTFRNDEGRGEFPNKFEEYSNVSTPSNDDFLNITNVAMNALYNKADGQSAASGGYILFSDYSNTQNRYFLTAMIKQKDGITISEDLELETLLALDLRRLHQAARISFGKLSLYLAAEEHDRMDLSYLSFVSPSSNKAAAGYFIKALGCAAGVASARATKNVIKESVDFFRQEESLKPHMRDFKSRLIGYLTSKQADDESAKLSEIEEIARQFMPADEPGMADEMADAFVTHLNSEELAVPVEFKINKRALHRHTHITGRADNWEIKFERGALGEDEDAQIWYDKELGRLVIKELPTAVILNIEEELGERHLE